MALQQPFEVVSDNSGSFFSSTNSMSRIVGFSFLASIVTGLLHGQSALSGRQSGGNAAAGGQSSYVMDSVKLFLLGSIIEGGRRFFAWIMGRFKPFQYSITAQFSEGDPAYEWIILLLTEEQIWTRSREFRVNATSSLRQWSVKLESQTEKKDGHADDHAEYVPTYEEPQLFRWKGYWVEVRRTALGNGRAGNMVYNFNPGMQVNGRLFLTMYTRNMSALSAMVEEARDRYVKTSRPHVIVHTADQPAYGPQSPWTNAKRKARRPLSSIILQEGVINSLLEDAREFIRTEEWYIKAGIPHRRGYLLYGPPGTGKSSTIYAIAGELGLEIYSLSLASGFVDDSFLSRAVSSIPKQAIFLIEDIDCAFPSREDLDDDDALGMPAGGVMVPGMIMPGRPGGRARSAVTMSGLLNVLDGVGSEEGKIFFATTNYVDRLDPALMRPGRIDKKIQYKLATKAQAAALFLRFYPEAFITLRSERSSTDEKSAHLSSSEKESIIHSLSEQFAAAVPEHEFSTAELQGFLLSCKQDPERAVEEVVQWVESERTERAAREKREEEEKAKKKEKRDARDAKRLHGGLARLGVNLPEAGPSAGAPPPALARPGAPSAAAATTPTMTTPSSNPPSTAPVFTMSNAEPPPVQGAAPPVADSSPVTKPTVNGTREGVQGENSGRETPN